MIRRYSPVHGSRSVLVLLGTHPTSATQLTVRHILHGHLLRRVPFPPWVTKQNGETTQLLITLFMLVVDIAIKTHDEI